MIWDLVELHILGVTIIRPHTQSERLDRACSSLSWSSLFPEARVLHIESPYSDHAPLIIELRPKMKWDLSGCRKRFRFEAAWTQEPDCEAIVTTAWLVPDSPQPECRLHEKLASVSARLSCWGRTFGREARERITELERLLVETNNAIMTTVDRSRALQEKVELAKLILQEEIFWKQRSKNLWLKEGDRNSNFFHAKASYRHQINSIRRLRTLDGSWIESVEGIQRCILEYFEVCSHRVDLRQMISVVAQKTFSP
ncbi:UNVERIFIED_CONTAM: hypothetical protein Scaly_1455500 [Sesamum calycinum]|uniref:Endonuclease/exonuclease/phosphatase n=1 Tax=Sesamum calycinum TaxID=2727403 RepID=A0AAW2PRY9_9LAMI